MPDYFQKHPKSLYEFRYFDSEGKEVVEELRLTDINVKLRLSDEARASASTFYPYIWKDNFRPDEMAEIYYSDVNLYWLVLRSNGVFDVHNEMPQSESQFNEYIYRKYREEAIESGRADTIEDVVAYSKVTITHYEDEDGDIIDLQTFTATPGGKSVSIYDDEFNQNERKRSFNLLRSSLKDRARTEFDDLLSDIKKGRVE